MYRARQAECVTHPDCTHTGNPFGLSIKKVDPHHVRMVFLG